MPRSERSFLAFCFAALLAAVAAPAAAESARVAILPVVVHAMDEQVYLQNGLADMLASRLGQHSGVGVVRVGDAAAATTDVEEARAQGRAAGAEWVLFGSFTRFGSGASLDLRCVPVSGEAEADSRAVFVQSGSLDQIIPRLSGVAERIAAHLHAGPVAAVDVAAPPSGARSAAADAEIQALRRRVEALEAEVYEAESVSE